MSEPPPLAQEPPEPAEQLGRLWQQPEVDAFLAQAGPLTPAQAVPVTHIHDTLEYQMFLREARKGRRQP